MNRAYLVVTIIVTIAVNVAVSNLTRSQSKKDCTISTQSHDQPKDLRQLSSSASRLIYHSKMIVAESIVVTKHSINLILDSAIKAL